VIAVGVLLWLFTERKSAGRRPLSIARYVFFAMFLGGILANWLFLNVFQRGVIFEFDKYEVFYDMQFGLAVIAILAAIGVLAGEKRFFCRYLCPVGLSLRFLSAIPFPVKYKVAAVGEGCAKCGKCDRECFMAQKPMEEINDHQVVSSPDCINCLACVSACPKNVLDFKNVKAPGEKAGTKAEEDDKTTAV
jgi:polyferredoxin